MIERIEHAIAYYDKVLLFETMESCCSFLKFPLARFCGSKLLFLAPGINMPLLEENNISIQQIFVKEIQQLKELYFTYEFSDRFLLISEKKANYANFCSMIDAGILTLEESIKALLI